MFQNFSELYDTSLACQLWIITLKILLWEESGRHFAVLSVKGALFSTFRVDFELSNCF